MPKKRKAKDAIKDVLEGDLHFADLTRTERKHFELIQMIEALWLDGKSDTYVRNACFEKFSFSRTKIRNAMNDTREVFGDLRVVNRNFQRHRAEQMAIRAYELAERQENPGAMARATKVYLEATGVNNEDPNLPDFENMQATLNVLMLPPEQMELIKLQAAQGVINDTELPPGHEDLAASEYLEYETVESAAGDGVQGND